MIQILITASTIASMLRLATPLLIAAIGGSFTFHANVFNIALEGFMLIACFFSAWATITFVSPIVGVLAGIVAGILAAALFALLVLILKADNIVVGLAINLGSTGLTTWLIQSIYHTRGFVMIPSGGFPNLQIPMISSIPYLGNVLSNQNLLVYLTFTLAVAGEYFLYRNVFGIRLRAIGEYPEAAQSVGIDVTRYRFISILASGLFCGFAGSFLTLSGASMFSEGMTAGAGFIALAVVFFSQGRPLTMIFASLLFGYTESISVSLQQFKVPSQLMLMLPYLMTVVALTIISIVNQRKGRHEAAAD
jgi:ABC-type uncharacterized transport system permease subunit